MISASNNVEVGVLGDGDEILDVVGQRHRAVWEEEGLEFGALGHAELGDQREAADDGLNKRRDVSERGDGEDVEWSYLDCWRLEARTERPVRPLSAAALPMEAATLGGRGYWDGIIWGITVDPKVT